MPSSRPCALLAKLTPPRVQSALRRERLFASLEEGRSRPVVWVCGPPGAGKTILVAGYLAQHKVPAIWYQVDAGDADPAAFFHYLAHASPRGRRHQPLLPALTPEYLPDLEGFSRRFFRDLFARLGSAGVLVLDNFQEASPASVFHSVVAVAVDELPPGTTLFVISRTVPPPQFARHSAAGRVVTIGWEALRLSVEETAAIASCNGITETAAAHVLHEQCAGWAGGLRLVLEELRRSGSLQALRHAETLDAVFAYFADQVFAAMPAATQTFLLRTSVLPRMTAALAQEISGDRAAGRTLEDLYRRNLFTERRIGEHVTYQYHALFRAFLATRALETLSDPERRALQARAAALLERSELLEDAVDVYQAAEQWGPIARLVTDNAARLLDQGRGLTLRRWIEALPAKHVQQAPALPYWLGLSLIPVDQERARLALEQAYRLYVQTSDVTGQLLTTAGIIEARFLQHSNHRLIDPWLPVHERLLAQVRADTPTEAQLRAFATMLIALLYREPGNATLEACAQRVLVLLESVEIAANPRMAAATFLVWYCGYTGDFQTMRRLVPLATALAVRPEVTPLHRANWWTWLGYCRHCMLDDEAALASLEPALALGEEHGLPAVVFLSSYFLGLVASRLGKQDVANQCLGRMEALADPHSRIQRAIVHAFRGWLALESEQPGQALRDGEAAWEIGAELGSPSYLVHWGTPMVYGLVETRRFAEARRRLVLQRDALRGTRIRCFDSMLMAIEATLALREGDEDTARRLVGPMFRAAREHGHGGYLSRVRPWMGQLAALALDVGEEVEYVREFIGQARLEPPSQTVHRWPWRWKVMALGRFQVLVDGQPIEYSRKAPKKLLALLRALIAAGTNGADEEALCDALWPDLEGDAAHRALASAIHRLRGLLGAAETVQVADNRVWLDPRRIWVDAWVFEALADTAQSAPHGDLAPLLDTVDLYRGVFLPGQAETGWTLSVRERLRAKFIRLTGQVAATQEAAGRLEQAANLYRRGLEVDDLAEPFCRGLMRCCIGLDRASEGVIAYRNLRQLLAVTLGRRPSRDTEALYRTLVGPEPAG